MAGLAFWRKQEVRADNKDIDVLADQKAVIRKGWIAAEQVAASVACVNAIAGGLALAEPQPANTRTAILTPGTLASLALGLLTKGEALAAMLVQDGRLQAVPGAFWDVQGRTPTEAGWVYEIELATPAGNIRRVLESGAVLHPRIAPPAFQPWRGTPPLQQASQTATVASQLEQYLSNEVLTPSGSFISVFSDSSILDATTIRSDLLKGSVRVHSANTRGEAQVTQYGPHFDGATPGLRQQVREDIYSLFGVPPGFFGATSQAASREAARQFVTLTLPRYSAPIEEEAARKLDTGPVRLRLHRLRALDIQQRSRAAAQFVGMDGISTERALQLAGLED